MSIPYGLSAILLMTVPASATYAVQAIYIFVTYNLCTTICYTSLNLPYSSLAPTMTNDDNDLAKLNLFRMSMSPIGNLIITALTLPFINMLGGDRKAWILVTAIYAVIAFAMLMWTFFGTKERFRPAAAKEAEGLPLVTRLGAAFRNKYFIMLTLTMISVSLYQNVNGTCTTYYAQYVLGNVEVMGVLQTAEKIPWIIGVIVLAPFIKKFGKRNLVLFGALLNIVAMILVQFAPTSYPGLHKWEKNSNIELPVWMLWGMEEEWLIPGTPTHENETGFTIKMWLKRNHKEEMIPEDWDTCHGKVNGRFIDYSFEKEGTAPVYYTQVDYMPHATIPEMSFRIWEEFFSKIVRK